MSKKVNLKFFTLIELIFVIGILVILISISWVNGSKTIKTVSTKQVQAEILLIRTALRSYETRWGDFPQSTSDLVDFGEYLSSISPHEDYVNPANKPLPREMYIDLKSSNINAENKDCYAYTKSKHGAVIPKVIIQDPYEQPYVYKVSGNTFEVISVGLDGTLGTDDDIQ